MNQWWHKMYIWLSSSSKKYLLLQPGCIKKLQYTKYSTEQILWAQIIVKLLKVIFYPCLCSSLSCYWIITQGGNKSVEATAKTHEFSLSFTFPREINVSGDYTCLLSQSLLLSSSARDSKVKQYRPVWVYSCRSVSICMEVTWSAVGLCRLLRLRALTQDSRDERSILVCVCERGCMWRYFSEHAYPCVCAGVSVYQGRISGVNPHLKE